MEENKRFQSALSRKVQELKDSTGCIDDGYQTLSHDKLNLSINESIIQFVKRNPDTVSKGYNFHFIYRRIWDIFTLDDLTPFIWILGDTHIEAFVLNYKKLTLIDPEDIDNFQDEVWLTLKEHVGTPNNISTRQKIEDIILAQTYHFIQTDALMLNINRMMRYHFDTHAVIFDANDLRLYRESTEYFPRDKDLTFTLGLNGIEHPVCSVDHIVEEFPEYESRKREAYRLVYNTNRHCIPMFISSYSVANSEPDPEIQPFGNMMVFQTIASGSRKYIEFNITPTMYHYSNLINLAAKFISSLPFEINMPKEYPILTSIDIMKRGDKSQLIWGVQDVLAYFIGVFRYDPVTVFGEETVHSMNNVLRRGY